MVIKKHKILKSLIMSLIEIKYVEKLRLGAYSSFRAYFNPLTFSLQIQRKVYLRISDYQDKSRNLGRKLGYPKISDDSEKTLGDVPTRMITGIVDIGNSRKTYLSKKL